MIPKIPFNNTLIKDTWAYLETILPQTYNELNRVVMALVTNNDKVQDELDLKAPLASPALTGSPTAPTQSAGDSTTRLATTAFVTTAVVPKANIASPAFTGVPTAPTAASSNNTTQLATTAFVKMIATAQNTGGIIAMSLRKNGYIKFAGNYIVQWGYAVASGRGPGRRVNLNIAFSNTNYNIQTSKYGGGSSTINIYNQNTAYFGAGCEGQGGSGFSDTKDIFWLAMG